MKNIHLIPTDKPSMLVKIKDNLFYTTTENIPGGNYQNIYITSNEEIKDGDWIKWGEAIYKANKKYMPPFKKVILTTDQDLIKDGVQAIDDEFLEWFAQNPSCERVKIEKVDKFFYHKHGDDNIPYFYKIIIPKEEEECNNCEWDYDMCPNAEECFKHTYKTIIPQEESLKSFKEKQKEILIEMMRDDEELGLYEEPKQETFKEVKPKDIQRIIASTNAQSASIEILQLFSQWQAQRMYSEEEVMDLFRKYQYDLSQWVLRMEDDIDGKPIPTEWFLNNLKRNK